MSAGIKTDNFATNWLIDRISNSSTKNPETGKMEAGFWEGLAGSAFGLDNSLIGSTKETNINNQAGNNLLEANGLTRSELGIGENANITTGLVGSKTREYKEQKDKDAAALLRTQTVDDRDAGYKQANAGLTAQLKSAELTANTALQSQQNQFAHTSEQNALTRRHENERGEKRDALSLQMQVMQNDLAEKRMDYDRETARMDKRSQAIAQLMSGLGSLGGVFSL
jgi:hypothetical protein